jgi:thioredoxin 1
MKQIDSTTYNELINSKTLTVIKYFAVWCRPCSVLSPIIEDVVKNYSDINVGEVDIDVHTDLAVKDGIRGVPAVVFYKDGQIVERIVGMRPPNFYTEVIEKYK